MLEKMTGYTAIIEMARTTNVITAGSRKVVRLTGNTEERMIVIKKTIYGLQKTHVFDK
jgi:hypothetical protein